MSPRPAYPVAVRELCEFAAKQGDLDLRFTPAPTAEEGMAGHKTVAARRGGDHRAEIAVAGCYEELQVRGRIDGYSASRQLLEEVKTFKGELQRMPANHRALHWAQAKVYAWLLCSQLGLTELRVGLVYFDIDTQAETPFVERCSAAALQAFFESLCARFLAWARQQGEHREQRDRALAALAFPHGAFRGGQRALAENAYKAVQRGRCLLAQAPTGIGKTIGTLFPLLKAAPQRLDKLFFLSAKTAGRAVALEALDALQRSDPALPLRVVELVARDKVCEHPDKACHGESCPLARGFYDKLPQARAAAVRARRMTREPLRELAREHGLCPYYLSQELVRWADVVVGDYNYFFDCGGALLHGLTAVNEWKVALLVDEAHNLVERARTMYSAELVQSELQAAVDAAPAAAATALRRVLRAWRALLKTQAGAAYQVHAAPPEALLSKLRDAASALAEACADRAAGADDPLPRFYFAALQFVRLADAFGPHSLFDASIEQRVGKGRRSRAATSTLCIRNVVPAPFLKPRFAAAHAAVLFSATLTPQHFYADALGLPRDTAWLDVASAFSAEQLEVRIVDDIPTRYRRRGESVAPIAQLMGEQFAARPGNYLAFFSSFDYLEQVLAEFTRRCPDVAAWVQTRQMKEPDRQAFLARFAPDGAGIGFAVLGGTFAEGIDLPGTRLVGAFIATLGLPQFNAVNEEMRKVIDAAFGAGYEYTYLYPGIRKVVQAAGRVIRTPSDRGRLFLIDDRYARREVRELLPSWWDVRRDGSTPRSERAPGGSADSLPT